MEIFLQNTNVCMHRSLVADIRRISMSHPVEMSCCRVAHQSLMCSKKLKYIGCVPQCYCLKQARNSKVRPECLKHCHAVDTIEF